MFKLIFTAALCAVAVFSPLAAQKKTAGSYPTDKYREFVPIAPIEYFDNVEIASPTEGVKVKYIKTLTKAEMLKFLTNETVLTSVAEVDKNGVVTYIPTRISQKGKQYIVTMDYIKFATMDLKAEGERTGEACVGVGFRMVANISSKAENVNLGDLFSIGMAVKDKKVYGSLRLEAIGLHDPQITSAIPLPSEISSATIQSMMQTMSVIKYKMYEEGIELSPQILAARATKEGVSFAEILSAVMNYHDLGKKNATQSTNMTTTEVKD